jgi:CPA1 family monovalent cation:H+ antiporter
VALAFSAPHISGRPAILAATYAVVIFSVIVQGTTIGKVIQYAQAKAA